MSVKYYSYIAQYTWHICMQIFMGENTFWNEWYSGPVMDPCAYLNKTAYIKKSFLISKFHFKNLSLAVEFWHPVKHGYALHYWRSLSFKHQSECQTNWQVASHYNRWWSLIFLMWLSFLLEIVDGNPKMTLGMIWTIILRFAIQDITVEGVYWSEITLDLRTRIERKR